MKRNWIVSKREHENLLKQIIANRGISPDCFSNFINPDYKEDLLDSELLPDYSKFVVRLKKALEMSERVGIFADYDADGTPGAALLARALDKIGLKYEVYIPSREEGYGLSNKGIDELISRGCKLIITVDLGIKSVTEAKYCMAKNTDIIITDHHLPGDNLPNAFAVINPKISSSKYPFRELCGCGLIYKLIYGLQKYFPTEIDEHFLKWNLDLAAVSTISDVVPLVEENRVIAKYGLIVLNKTKNLGLQKLIEISALEKGKIAAYHVGFVIGPRLNAPGRIKDARKAFELLITKDSSIAGELAKELDQENRVRQEQMENLLKAADIEIESKNLQNNKIIVLSGPWPKGVIGPSASRIAERYMRPTIIFSDNESEHTGSARTYGSIDIYKLISGVKRHLSKFGGHKGAAGLSIDHKKYDIFLKELLELASVKISDEELNPVYKIDAEIDFDHLSFDLLEQMQLLEPFGLGNPRPLFVSKNVAVCRPRTVGKNNNHLSMVLEHKNKRIKSIFFSHPYIDGCPTEGTSADVVYSVNIDQWNGKRYININVADMDLHEKR